ncbi:phosphohydrolase [Gordonia sp. PKS22-38]|uniref:Phosphohydrolase n=1 Tax=Gordonia prachuapensis TaxID=3115651 RepID=A0ABU7MNM5_9ACTN|nr:phosphohydrolase [Gordonia sp. PKS22-38]
MPTLKSLDWDWATSTGGTLSTRQKVELLGPLLRAVTSYPMVRLRLATSLRGSGRVDLDELRFPDSALARDAAAEAREVVSPHVLEHSYRTYIFGLALAGLQGAHIDEELNFVACMLHDTHLEDPTPGRCFAVVGGERAERFALDRGVDDDRAAALGAAIAGHINIGADSDLGDPAGFVAAGAWADLTGIGLDRFDGEWVDTVHDRYPRRDLRRNLLTAWEAEQQAVPRGRAQWATRWGGFPTLLKMAPFDE